MKLEAIEVSSDVEALLGARCPSEVGWVVDGDRAADGVDGVAGCVEFATESLPGRCAFDVAITHEIEG